MTDRLNAREFEAAAIGKVRDSVPDADLAALRASLDLIRLANRWWAHLEQEVHRPAGWSMAGFRLMFVLWVAGDLEPRDLARLSGLGRPSVSSALNTLERDGLVERSREADDRRLVTVRLTDDGRQRIGEAYRRQNAVEHDFFGAIGRSELRGLADVLQRLLEAPLPDENG